ncbi:hypothetical protein [Bacillus sp. FJAT-45037]|uniref:hypothetical protein n=1 Tax=Bacillus sp. FJAT-45037 TaxID=2011007 RepID=UPI000C2426D7|nr:hypothetical protein [Bacillus sp. FJAT-45037]
MGIDILLLAFLMVNRNVTRHTIKDFVIIENTAGEGEFMDMIDHRSLNEASEAVFQLLKESIGINTFFIAKNDGKTVDVLSVENQDKTLLEKGFQIDFQESY